MTHELTQRARAERRAVSEGHEAAGFVDRAARIPRSLQAALVAPGDRPMSAAHGRVRLS